MLFNRVNGKCQPIRSWRMVSWVVLVCVLGLAGRAIADSNEPLNWVWVHGRNTCDQLGSYGTKGVAELLNVPGGRSSSVSWTDSDDNLWLFGGEGYGISSSGNLNDLWRFDGTNWTWVSGSNTSNQFSVYGDKGVPDANNVPGARKYSISWTDSNDNLWLFGGDGYDTSSSGTLNDLWKFDDANWTWVSGADTVNQTGSYGNKGVADSRNMPGARWGSVSWIDSDGNLWLFGGWGYDSSNQGHLNDLWKFDGTNWTWVSGSNTRDQFGIYGDKGVHHPNNVPGARKVSVSWIGGDDDLWLFGGWGYGTSSSQGKLNDLWRFDGTEWTWISGANVINQLGSYGTQGVAEPNNVPGARHKSVSWTDSNDNLWLFGGYGFGDVAEGLLNDLWRFDGAEWAWISGANTVDQYGSYWSWGVVDPNNVPGGRDSSVSWVDSKNNLWLFGGFGYASCSIGYLQDLWKVERFCEGPIVGDINKDCKVDFVDFAIMALHWLEDKKL